VYIQCMAQAYRVKRHKGVRSRPMISITLSTEEIAILERVSAKRGLTRSSLIGQLLRGLERIGQ
jgi:hypothetical protein